MQLNNPIIVTPPSVKKQDGTTKTFDPITLNELDITIIDNSYRKTVLAQIRPFAMPLVLWAGDEYTSAGDYTQSQVENRILELLGDDPKSVLEGLFVQPPLPRPLPKK